MILRGPSFALCKFPSVNLLTLVLTAITSEPSHSLDAYHTLDQQTTFIHSLRISLKLCTLYHSSGRFRQLSSSKSVLSLKTTSRNTAPNPFQQTETDPYLSSQLRAISEQSTQMKMPAGNRIDSVSATPAETGQHRQASSSQAKSAAPNGAGNS